MRSRSFLMVLFLLLSVACTPKVQSVPETQVNQAPGIVPATETALPQNTATTAPTATETPTQTPTDTPAPVTPAATVNPLLATAEAMAGSAIIMTSYSQYLDPVGTPLTSWKNIPIMPQATAGQEFTANIYSYKAAATLAQALQFYLSNKSLGYAEPPVQLSSGTGSQASHNSSILYSGLPQTIVVSSYDNDTGHVVVVIDKSG